MYFIRVSSYARKTGPNRKIQFNILYSNDARYDFVGIPIKINFNQLSGTYSRFGVTKNRLKGRKFDNVSKIRTYLTTDENDGTPSSVEGRS